jgi:hypothetical protein
VSSTFEVDYTCISVLSTSPLFIPFSPMIMRFFKQSFWALSVATMLVCSSCATTSLSLAERLEDIRRTAIIRHLGKSFPPTDSAEILYDTQVLAGRPHEFFGEVVTVRLYNYQDVDESELSEFLLREEAKRRGANAVIVSNTGFDVYGGSFSIRGRLVRYK